MINELIAYGHFLRPWCLLLCLPWIVFCIYLLRTHHHALGWAAICNPLLLKQLMVIRNNKNKIGDALLLFFIGFFMIIALSGPTWHRLKTPVYRQLVPHVLLLDMSANHPLSGVSSSFLTHAVFALHDILNAPLQGQWGLIAFTSEPFIVSPLTQDAKNIDALLPMIQPDIMPVEGYDLTKALKEASSLIHNAGYMRGQILVFTATEPSEAVIKSAADLARAGMSVSVIPFLKPGATLLPYQKMAKAGDGAVFPLSNDMSKLIAWLSEHSLQNIYSETQAGYIPLWRDEGHWFVIPVLLLLLRIFQRGWLQRVFI